MITRFSHALFFCALVSLAAAAPVSADAAEAPRALLPDAGPQTPAPRIAIGDEPPGAALAALDRAGRLAYPVAVRVVAPVFPADATLDARLAALAARHVPVWLSVPAPEAQPDIERWQNALRALLDKHHAALTILEVTIDGQPARVATFALQIAATEVRASHDAIRIAIGGAAMADEARRVEIYRAELAPYVDLLAIPDATEATGGWPSWPAATWVFCCWMAVTTSGAVRPRATIFSGSSHTRML